MILAGIDEAGLGPAMGPLCVATAIFAAPGGTTPAEPWKLLDGLVTAQKRVKAAPLLIADSKIAYAARGMAGLEEAALSFLLACCCVDTLDFSGHGRANILTECGGAQTLRHLSECPWYADSEWKIPAFGDGEKILSCAGKLCASSLKPLHLRAQVLTAGMLNSLFARELNKSEVLLMQTGEHLRFLRTNFPAEEILVIVDKQGGRNFYAPFLSDIFDGAWVQTICEGAELSEYQIDNLRVRFLPKADRDAFPVALASIFAKYLRERFMEDLNTFFRAKIPGLAPTAGYHGDAPRFMEAIRPLLPGLNVSEDLLWRQR